MLQNLLVNDGYFKEHQNDILDLGAFSYGLEGNILEEITKTNIDILEKGVLARTLFCLERQFYADIEHGDDEGVQTKTWTLKNLINIAIGAYRYNDYAIVDFVQSNIYDVIEIYRKEK